MAATSPISIYGTSSDDSEGTSVISISSTSTQNNNQIAEEVMSGNVAVASSGFTSIRMHVNDLDGFLKSRPRLRLNQTKYNSHRTKKYEYRSCLCGCGYKMNLVFQDDFMSVKDWVIPSHHQTTYEHQLSNVQMTDQVKDLIDDIAAQNKFERCFGAVKIIKKLRDEHNIAEENLPDNRQINNRLQYLRDKVFNFNNNITCLESELLPHVHSGNQLPHEPLIFLCDQDEDGK